MGSRCDHVMNDMLLLWCSVFVCVWIFFRSFLYFYIDVYSVDRQLFQTVGMPHSLHYMVQGYICMCIYLGIETMAMFLLMMSMFCINISVHDGLYVVAVCMWCVFYKHNATLDYILDSRVCMVRCFSLLLGFLFDTLRYLSLWIV